VSVAAAGRASERAHRQLPLARIVVVWLLATATIVGLGALLSGVNVKSVGPALAAAAVIGLVNALAWPIVVWFALPLTVMTLGLGVVVLNGATVLPGPA
jgi:putative membrane protein